MTYDDFHILLGRMYNRRFTITEECFGFTFRSTDFDMIIRYRFDDQVKFSSAIKNLEHVFWIERTESWYAGYQFLVRQNDDEVLFDACDMEEDEIEVFVYAVCTKDDFSFTELNVDLGKYSVQEESKPA
jgi:hypothetical protein